MHCVWPRAVESDEFKATLALGVNCHTRWELALQLAQARLAELNTHMLAALEMKTAAPEAAPTAWVFFSACALKWPMPSCRPTTVCLTLAWFIQLPVSGAPTRISARAMAITTMSSMREKPWQCLALPPRSSFVVLACKGISV